MGGSFNPAHGGHLATARRAIRAGRLDALWWLVSPGNPLKPRTGMAPLAARLASAQRLARRAPIRASAAEMILGTRFTVDTLAALARRNSHRRLVWVMGADNLAQFHEWRQWRVIARRFPMLVIARPGHDGLAIRSRALRWMRSAGGRVLTTRSVAPAGWLDGPLPRVLLVKGPRDRRSATAIRARRPEWAVEMSRPLLRDPVTRRRLPTIAPPPATGHIGGQ